MALNPFMKTFLELVNPYHQVPIHELTIEKVRSENDKMFEMQMEKVPINKVEDLKIDADNRLIPIRIYTPEGDPPFPTLVYYHGGGFVMCSVETHDPLCREIANTVGCKVISIDYRLAPENKYPAAVEDAYDSLAWIASHSDELQVDPRRLAVGGDSSGANLAAVVCLMAREKGFPSLIHQLLLYPVVTFIEVLPSMHENAEGYLLTRDLMIWLGFQYFANLAHASEPYASPLTTDLTGLPAATIITAEYDPARDHGRAYAQKLRDSGVEVVLQNCDDMIHNFANFTGICSDARLALQAGLVPLKTAFNK